MSIQVDENLITHDPTKDSRCNFGRRTIYGEEQFAIHEKFIKTPLPQRQNQDSSSFWLACLTCFDKQKILSVGIENLIL
jgi:hypothetical protein